MTVIDEKVINAYYDFLIFGLTNLAQIDPSRIQIVRQSHLILSHPR